MFLVPDLATQSSQVANGILQISRWRQTSLFAIYMHDMSCTQETYQMIKLSSKAAICNLIKHFYYIF